MSQRRLNPRLAKTHRNYTVEEIACLFGVHKNTVRTWIKSGLPICDDKRPLLILGRDLRFYLQERRNKNKRPCSPDTIYCVRCKEPKTPLGKMVDYEPITNTKGKLVGICPCCNAVMNQFTSLAKLEGIRGLLDVTMPQA